MVRGRKEIRPSSGRKEMLRWKRERVGDDPVDSQRGGESGPLKQRQAPENTGDIKRMEALELDLVEGRESRQQSAGGDERVAEASDRRIVKMLEEYK